MTVPAPPATGTAPGPSPTTRDPDNFDARADLLLSWLPGWANNTLPAVLKWIKDAADMIKAWALEADASADTATAKAAAAASSAQTAQAGASTATAGANAASASAQAAASSQTAAKTSADAAKLSADQAASSAGVASSGGIRWDRAQTLTAAQQTQALANIGAMGVIPAPPNMIKNPYMDSVVNGVPEGYSSSGVEISAVHPYTKGFEGPYRPSRPSNAVDDWGLATSDAPFWFGVYNKGPRFPNWGGGLADGWGGLGSGRILKVTGAAVPGVENRQVYFPMVRRTYASRLGFRAWIHLAKGSAIRFGNHAGYQNMGGDIVFTKADIDASPQGWKFVDFVIDTSSGMWIHGNTLAMGFSCNEDIEAYIAMPYLYTFLYTGRAGLPMGE